MNDCPEVSVHGSPIFIGTLQVDEGIPNRIHIGNDESIVMIQCCPVVAVLDILKNRVFELEKQLAFFQEVEKEFRLLQEVVKNTSMQVDVFQLERDVKLLNKTL